MNKMSPGANQVVPESLIARLESIAIHALRTRSLP